MNRARARALVLVNWRGVFYERYLLDPNVTALEGPNGAGKTTVMIAAYLVLLPDLARLRFTNVGESGASAGDRGIWGRLGEEDRPSFAGLLIQTAQDSATLLAVHIERKSQPTLQLTPFIVTGLKPDAALHKLFLISDGDHDQLPTLKELKVQLKSYQKAQPEVDFTFFGSVKDYLRTLFDMGVSPIRLVTDEERSKFNEMLRTSMAGGISRALTTELRTFIFKQESHLSETLKRVRSNLNACRKTRTEVADARRLEEEISGIFETGQAMFRAAFYAAHREKDTLEAQLSNARAQRDTLSAKRDQLAALVSEESARKQRLQSRIDALTARVADATNRLETLGRARKAQHRVLALKQEVQPHAEALLLAEGELQAAQKDRERCREDAQAALASINRAASALADLQHGLDELHHRAHAYKRLEAAKSQVKELASQGATAANGAPFDLDSVQQRIQSLDEERAVRERGSVTLEQQARDYAAAHTAATTLLGLGAGADDLDASVLYERALDKLRELEQLETLRGQRATLEAEHARLKSLSERQVAALTRFDALLKDLEALDLETLNLETPDTETLDTATSSDLSAKELSLESIQQRKQQLESQVLQQESAYREALWKGSHERDKQVQAQAQRSAVAQRSARWQELEAIATTLAPQLDPASVAAGEVTASSLRDRHTELSRQRDVAAAGAEAQLAEAKALSSLADSICTAAGEFPEEILQLRDEVDGELLVRRFDTVSSETAAGLEAQLGALRHAVVVEDLDAAIDQVRRLPTTLKDIWLVDTSWQPPELESTPAEQADDDVVVRFPSGARVTRKPSKPALGEQARVVRIKQLRQQADAAEAQAESLRQELRDLTQQLRQVETLREGFDDWQQGDPAIAQAAIDEEVNTSLAAAQLAQENADTLRASIKQSHHALDILRELAALSPWREQGDHSLLLEEHERLLDKVRSADQQLATLSSARADAQTSLLSLKLGPPENAKLEQWLAQKEELDAERDRLWQLKGALEQVQEHRAASTWSDAAKALEERQELVPALKKQYETTQAHAQDLEHRQQELETRWEQQSRTYQSVRAQQLAAAAHLERAEQEFDELGLSDCSDAALNLAEDQQRQCQEELARRLDERQNFATKQAVLEERLALLEDRLSEMDRELAASEAAVAPARARVTALETERDRLKLPVPSSIDEGTWSWPGADSKRALLRDRLHAAAGGGDLAARCDALSATGSATARGYLELWCEVRAWLLARLPAQVAQTDDAVGGLDRLRGDLQALEQRLRRQELVLRGNTTDVARSIDAQTRRAAAQVRRLNQYLVGVTFGSIHGIRIKLGRVERMDQVLEALRSDSIKSLLFEATLPVEEALNEIFQRYGGGKGNGHRILDYREYLALSVEVQRRGKAEWEQANPSRVSTGEAIGIGAALMMVILTEWERDANLLRQKRAMGSLRFLFLDEANRLSQENLGVLFDLCQSLELQLLIAAPEVARAEGNTTYRLVRRVAEDGQEDVVVSGRRAILPESDANADLTHRQQEPAAGEALASANTDKRHDEPPSVPEPASIRQPETSIMAEQQPDLFAPAE